MSTKRVALVIGNWKYEIVDPLRNPANDANALAAALGRIGFSGIRTNGRSFDVDFDQAGVTAIENLGYDQMRRAFAAFAGAAEGALQAVLYFAGHGIEVEGQNYLIPVDAELSQARSVEFETTSLMQVLGAVDGAKELRLVILDACRNNPFRARLVGARSIGARGLRSIEPPGNVLVAYAAKHGEVARDSIGSAKNSPYAEALLSHIEQPGLEVMDLLREVKATVFEATGGSQEPHWYGTLGRQRVYFLPPRSTVPSSGYKDGRALTEAAEAWSIIQETQQVDVLEAFRRRYPSTVYADFALLQIQTLKKPRPSEPFQDVEVGPKMMRVPAGDLLMGSLESENGSGRDERPVHQVRINAFAASICPVTVGEWEQARKNGFKGKNLKGPRRVPATSVLWQEAKDYTAWLAGMTGLKYRLLTEAEWEYACRAGTYTAYSTGAEITTSEAWFSTKYVQKGATDEIPGRAVPVGLHDPNKFGLFDMHGNVWEWVEDDYHASYVGAPDNGSAWVDKPRSIFRVIRGGCYASGPRHLRSARRGGCEFDGPRKRERIGFRVARDL